MLKPAIDIIISDEKKPFSIVTAVEQLAAIHFLNPRLSTVFIALLEMHVYEIISANIYMS